MNSYENLINMLLDGRYRLNSIINTSGMSVVYEADDMTMHRKVAVKMLKDEEKEDIQGVKRFISESKAIAMLSHPNIVQIFDVSVKDNDEHQYIVMEFIDGITLKDYIVRKGRLTWREAIGYVKQILNALNHAHSKGIIHRDIKPQNAMLLRNGNLKVIDFGIAKMQGSEPLTMTDKAIGTVHYISPEQASGTGNITNVSDIYSVGVLLYEMVTGALPFNGNTAIQVAMMQINDMPKDPRTIIPELPRGLAQIILKAMKKDPKDRYQNASEMIKHLSILSANPAVVFNSANNLNNFNNQVNQGIQNSQNHQNHQNNHGSRSNLPVVVSTENGAKKNPKSIEAVNRNNKVGNTNSMNNINNIHNINNLNQIDDINEDEMRKKGRKSKKNPLRPRNSKSMLPIISGVTLAFLIVLLWNIFQILTETPIVKNFIPDSEDTIKIPDYRGRVYDESLIADLEKDNLAVRHTEYKSNDNFEKDEIIIHKPEPAEIKKYPSNGGPILIDLIISAGKDKYVVEDLTIMDGRNQGLMLESKRLNVEFKNIPHDTVPSGYIVSTDPPKGTILEAGDTITLYVSTGIDRKMVIMANLVGETERNARWILARDEIVIERINMAYSDTVPAGCIIDQSIIPYKSVPRKSSRITYTISLGPIPTEPPPPTEPPTTTEAPPAPTPAPTEAPLITAEPPAE